MEEINSRYVRDRLEQDWDDDSLYYEVTEDGKIRKYDIVNYLTFEYAIEKVMH